MRFFIVLAAIGGSLVFGSAASADQAAVPAQPAVKVTPVTKADRNIGGQPIVFPQKDGEITAAIYEFPPGAVLPVHKHPYPRIGYVLSGTLQIENTDTGKTDTLKPGQMLLESVDQWHHGHNVGDTPVRMLVIDLTPKGASNTILQKK